MRQYFLPAAICLAQVARAEFGNSFYLGPFSGGQYITKATYSLSAPSVPTGFDSSDTSLWLSIWVGVQQSSEDVDNENLVQPLLNWCLDNESCGCDADETQWCVAANTYTPSGQEGESYVVVPSDAVLDFEIAVNSSTSYIDQKVWINGELVSQKSDSQGMKPGVIYSANECSDANCGTLPAFSWTNMTLTFNEAIDTVEPALNVATSTGFTTSDGGITWTADEINMGKDTAWS
ncbi:hypothetical protein BKA67DRAFT_660447 [Truncatella angustata]|uniref:Uncharacterized protein n=1 Tax=Truncatella angustata TaxID=152316 RepID=A0A9P8UGB2_9PEZI|nr:uncharacterized protein BKA67DRAFT_660447 [Truncatella angustata]KAH6651656.1 hypothetical protein BKA67DRAFT_660447 [Truncatella angustata]KAH8203553.1 hypothetical protein TruAng_002301 [Truncatella angustata]